MDLSGLPQVEIECVKDPDFQKQVPEQKLRTETQGHISDYIVKDDCAYYIVTYDYIYRDYCEQYAIYKQSFADQKIELCASKTFDQGYDGVEAGYDENMYWTAQDEDGTMHRFDVVGEEITESEYSKQMTSADDSWKQEIGDSEVLDNTNLIVANDQYIVWEQWRDDEDPAEDGQICVYQRKKKDLNIINKKEYGCVYQPEVIGDCMVFLTIDDVQSYKEDGDAYDNVYLVQLDTMEIQRITENQGNVDTVETTFHDKIHASDGTIYFTSRVHNGEDIEYEKLYYIKVQ